MNNVTTLVCLVGMLSLSACGGAGDDHPHDGGAGPHAHDGSVHSHGGAEGHAHEAPATEAFYGEEAVVAETDQEPGAAEDENDAHPEETHAHGDGEPHRHDH